MVLASISFHHRTPLVILEGNLTARRYFSNVFKEYVVPSLEQHPDFRIFQYDNARSCLSLDSPRTTSMLKCYWYYQDQLSRPISVPWNISGTSWGEGFVKGLIHPGRSWNWLMYPRRSGVGYRKRTYRLWLEAWAEDANQQSLQEVTTHDIRDPTPMIFDCVSITLVEADFIKDAQFLFCNGY